MWANSAACRGWWRSTTGFAPRAAQIGGVTRQIGIHPVTAALRGVKPPS